MKQLLFILSAVLLSVTNALPSSAGVAQKQLLEMTWTVETKTSVKGSGSTPYGLIATYECTYQKGTVRAGDMATLGLAGMQGLTIRSVDIYLKSNKSAGAGEIVLAVDGQEVTRLSGSFAQWTGAFDNSSFHAINLLRTTLYDVQEMEIQVTGMSNSLYVEKYVIAYEGDPPASVILMDNGSEYAVLTEDYAGAGVVLPALPPYGDWTFVGWTGTDFLRSSTKPDVLVNGQVYFPSGDTRLYSVWGRKDPAGEYITDLESGTYLYVNREAGWALWGLPENGIMTPGIVNTSDGNEMYYIDFLAPDTATIRHTLSGRYIGYEGTQLIVRESKWLVYHEGDQTLFYMCKGEQKYALWLNKMDSYQNYYTGLQAASRLENSPMVLMRTRTSDDEPLYTCYPDIVEGIENAPETQTPDVTVPFGIYGIQIRNGKKYIHLR